MINEKLEGDIMVRHILDVKGIDMGNGIIRYKAEVDVDGRELARFYLAKRDMEQMMKEVKLIETPQDLELFMLKHGENVVDCLGEEVDRIEQELKKAHPEVRHVDLEVLWTQIPTLFINTNDKIKVTSENLVIQTDFFCISFQ